MPEFGQISLPRLILHGLFIFMTCHVRQSFGWSMCTGPLFIVSSEEGNQPYATHFSGEECLPRQKNPSGQRSDRRAVKASCRSWFAWHRHYYAALTFAAQ